MFVMYCTVLCGVCCLSGGILRFVVWCEITVIMWFVCALVCDVVWCVCVCLFSCVLLVRFVLLCSNLCVFRLECIV